MTLSTVRTYVRPSAPSCNSNVKRRTIYSGLTQASIRDIAFMHSLPFRWQLLDLNMAEPAAEAQPQVPRAPEANVVRDILVDPAPAQAAQDANVQEVM